MQAHALAKTSETKAKVPDRKDMVSGLLDALLGAKPFRATVRVSGYSLFLRVIPLTVDVNLGICPHPVEPKNVRYEARM